MNGLESFLFFDKPIPYKSILLYPVLMSEYIEFHWAVNSLLLDKNSTPDPKVISMSYLEYLYYLAIQNNEVPYLSLLKMLLLLVLRIDAKEEDRIGFFMNDQRVPYFTIDGQEFYSDDLMEMKKIIFEQNCISDIDVTIQKEVRDAMEKAQEYKMKQNNRKICSLEEQMICVAISSPYKLEDIYKLTIRKFSKMLQRIDHKLHYQIYLSAEMSGFVKFDNKDAITWWMNDLDKKDKFSDVKVDMESMKNKIDNVNR